MNYDDLKELFVVSWSKSQNCFHIEKFDSMLDANSKIFMKDATVDYIPLAIAGTHEEAFEISKLIKEKKEQFKTK